MTKARQKNLKTFTIDYKSDDDDCRYLGQFTTKKLSIADLAALGVRKSQLNGGMYYDANNPGRGVDFDTDDLNAMISHLEISIVQSPKWWDLNSISDSYLLTLVYEEVLDFENSFRGSSDGESRNSDKPVGDIETNSSNTTQAANTDGNAGAVVVDEVQASLEP